MGSSVDSIIKNFPPDKIAVILDGCGDPLFKNKSFLQQKYVEEGLTCGEIAGQIFSARTTVLKYLKLHGIPVRETGTNQKRKRGLAYGQKVQGRQIETHQREQDNVKKMRELREKGYSYWKIAEVFNTLKIPTKTRKGKWHAKSIHQILNFDVRSRIEGHRQMFDPNEGSYQMSGAIMASRNGEEDFVST